MLSKRVLSARGAYRHKNRGQGELKAKCRIVALGHRDPDHHLWRSWLGDASTAFLQGTQEDAKRPMALFMFAPRDGLIDRTNCWKARLYEVLGNIYGLPTAPFLWTTHVIKIMIDLNYVQHSWDKMFFVKYDEAGHPLSLVMVYVDDFIALYRSDYNIEELRSRFSWGDLSEFQMNEVKTFKGKQLCFCKNPAGRTVLKVTMGSFLKLLTLSPFPEAD